MNKAQGLLEVLDELSWDNFHELADHVTKYEREDIDKEMQRQASVYSYYQGMLAIAKKRLDGANLELTQYCAETRKNTKEGSPKKLTAKDLDDAVESSEGFKEKSQDVHEAQLKYSLLKGLVSALEHKKDMLVQQSSQRRAEMQLYK